MWKMLNRVEAARHSSEYLGGCRFRELCELQCLEPRDRVFALVPLVNWKKAACQPFVVNYEDAILSIALESLSFCKDFDDLDQVLSD